MAVAAVVWVDGIQVDPVSAGSKDYKWIVDKMHKTIHPQSTVKKYEIISVSKVLNNKTWQNYTTTRTRLFTEMGSEEKVEEKRLFHATPQAKVISEGGFNIALAKSSGNFGAGIYFAEHSSKSNDYAFGCNGCCRSHSARGCSTCERTILVCRVALGKKFNTEQIGSVPPQGYHSLVFSGSVPEYVIYDDKQAYPSYIVQYKPVY